MPWIPNEHHKDPQVNALLNIAEAIDGLASATNRLRGGLKWDGTEGVSIAEALELGLKSLGESLSAAVKEAVEEPASTDSSG